MAASSRQDTSGGETSIDSSSSRNEVEPPTRTGKYHPRSILFSGPPQVMHNIGKEIDKPYLRVEISNQVAGQLIREIQNTQNKMRGYFQTVMVEKCEGRLS